MQVAPGEAFQLQSPGPLCVIEGREEEGVPSTTPALLE
jgi:hypothetical protein